MADGSIYIPVEIDDSNAEKQLAALNRKINSLENEISKGKAAEMPIAEQLREAQKAAIETLNEIDRLKAELASSERKTSIFGNVDANQFAAELEKQKELKAKIEEQEKLLAQQETAAQRLEAEDARRLEKLEQQTQELEQQKEAAGELAERVSKIQETEKLQDGFESIKDGITGGVKKLALFGFAVKSVSALMGKLRDYTIDAVSEFAESDADTKASIDELKNSLAGLKAQWGAAFSPVLSLVTPILQTLIGWLNKAANTIAAFFAALSGKSTYKKAVTGLNNVASAAGGAGSAAEEAKKQLMGIDELNVLQDTNSSGGGGGGGGGSDLEYIEEEVSNKIADFANFASTVAMNIKDFFVNWELTPENIFKKIMTGAWAILGGAIGFAIAGVPGAVIGATAGLVLSSSIQAMFFNNDGKLSKREVLNSLGVCLGAALGGAIGFAVGGPVGAAIGLIIGAGLTLNAKRILFGDTSEEITEADFIKKLVEVLIIAIGTGVGFAVGGPGGALVGATISLGVEMAAKKVLFPEGKNEITKMDILGGVCALLGGSLGAVAGFFIGGPGGAALGFSIGVGLELWASTIDLKQVGDSIWQGIVEFWEDIKGGFSTLWQWIVEAFIDPTIQAWNDLKEAVAFIMEALWGAVTTALENVKQGFEDAKNAINEKLEAIKGWWGDMIGSLKTGWQGFVDWLGGIAATIATPFVAAINGILNAWNTVADMLNSIAIDIPEITIIGKSVFAGAHIGLNVPYATPIAWGAKGGILNSATLIGAGEAGKEALIPLERNTGWMKTLAEQLVEIMGGNGLLDDIADYIAQIPNAIDRLTDGFTGMPILPAVASGTIVPPNSYNSGYGFNQELADKLANFLDSFGNSGDNTTRELHTHVYLDRREIGEAVTEYQTQKTRGRGL